jgi:outer membrane protein OmpA-like peptidoglycan-associated protein
LISHIDVDAVSLKVFGEGVRRNTLSIHTSMVNNAGKAILWKKLRIARGSAAVATGGDSVPRIPVPRSRAAEDDAASTTRISHAWVRVALLLLVTGGVSAHLNAAGWPKWPSKKDDVVTAACSLDRKEIEQGSSAAVHAKVDATDSKQHPLSYIWSGNGGKISGTGPEVQIDASGLNPGVYSVIAATRDAYKHSATCTATFQVMPSRDSIHMACSAEPASVEQGKAATLSASATDSLGHPLRYSWFSNGGVFRGDGAQVQLDTSGLAPGEYSITGRVDDSHGLAADCMAAVNVHLPPAPVLPATPSGLAEIIFRVNQSALDASMRSKLQRAIDRLRDDPAGRISIEAYAGPEEGHPDRLAAERADAAKRFFTENGIAESRIQVIIGQGGRRGGLRNRTLDVIWLPNGLEY